MRHWVFTTLSLTLPLIVLGLIAVQSAHATAIVQSSDGGVMWCKGDGTATLPTGFPLQTLETWGSIPVLTNPPFGDTGETVAPTGGDANDRYAIQLDYWNSVTSDPGGAIGYSTGASCMLFYYNTGNIGQFTITYSANPSQPIAAEETWVTNHPNTFPYVNNAPYSLGISDGGPTGYVSTFKGCSWDNNSCTTGSAVRTYGTTTVAPPNSDWNVFPEMLSTITSIPTTWNITSDPTYGTPFVKDGTHIWDASYDIWFDKNAETGLNSGQAPYGTVRGENDGLEIMVWMNSNNSYVDAPGSQPNQPGNYAQPSGWPREAVLINNVVYDVWTSRLNNAYFGYPSSTTDVVVKANTDQDTCTTLAVNGGAGVPCGSEWNVVSFVATKHNGTDYRTTGMSMDTKVFTDYILGINDGLWQQVTPNPGITTYSGNRISAAPATGSTPATIGVLACPASSMDGQQTDPPANPSKCLNQSWWLTSIQAGFEPWEGGAGLESSSFVAHVNTYASPVQSGLTSGNGTPIVAWNAPFQVVYPGCPANAGPPVSGVYTQPTTAPRFTIVGINGSSPYYPYITPQPAGAIPAWVPITITGPGNYNGYGTNNIVQGAYPATATLGQAMTWNPTTGMWEATMQSTLPLSAESGNGAPATIYISNPSCTTQPVASIAVYIDPSGKVFYSDGKTPVQGATVTLEYSPSNSATGPFEVVPNNNTGLTSDIMNPADNTLNPMSSTQYGSYAWDVAPGYYQVNAELNGCGAVTSPVQQVVTAPITNLFLDLPCAPPEPPNVVTATVPNVPAGLTATAVSSSQINLSWSPVLPPLNATSWTYTVYETSPAYTVIASGLSGNSYQVTGLTPGTSYAFAVTAVDAGGSSALSPSASTTTQPGSGNCHVTYNVASATPGVTNGLTVNINIQNTGKTALYPWTLAWTFPGNQKITNTWNVNESQSGQNVTLSSISSWESIPAGGTLTGAVGFNGTYTGANAKPTAFTLNGQPCN
jgi:hypothetical protein